MRETSLVPNANRTIIPRSPSLRTDIHTLSKYFRIECACLTRVNEITNLSAFQLQDHYLKVYLHSWINICTTAVDQLERRFFLHV